MAPIELPQLGTFQHEAAVVDPHTGIVYLTEDAGDSRFFRCVPAVTPPFGERPDFDAGQLQVLSLQGPEAPAYDTRTDTQEILHDPTVAGSQVNDADNLCVHPLTGDLFITEDAPQSIGIDVLVITAPDADGVRTVAPVIRAAPGQHAGSEFTGPVFDASGTRFYFSSQRMTSPNDPTNVAAGVIYEVTGPFTRTGWVAARRARALTQDADDER